MIKDLGNQSQPSSGFQYKTHRTDLIWSIKVSNLSVNTPEMAKVHHFFNAQKGAKGSGKVTGTGTRHPLCHQPSAASSCFIILSLLPNMWKLMLEKEGIGSSIVWSNPRRARGLDLKHTTFTQRAEHHKSQGCSLSWPLRNDPHTTSLYYNKHTHRARCWDQENFCPCGMRAIRGKYNESNAQTPTSAGVKDPRDRSSRNHTSLPRLAGQTKVFRRKKTVILRNVF